MPISREQFMNEQDKLKVFNFLQKNRKYAYTRNEIGKAVKMDPENVSSQLRYLKSRRKVLHKKPYWTVK